jgi:hypothetical protein
MMIGTDFSRPSLRITRASSKPSMRGISTSSSTTSGTRSCIFSSASTPSFALSTRNPSRVSRRVVILRTVSESSTTSTSGGCRALLTSSASAERLRHLGARQAGPAQRQRHRVADQDHAPVAAQWPGDTSDRAICGPMLLDHDFARAPRSSTARRTGWHRWRARRVVACTSCTASAPSRWQIGAVTRRARHFARRHRLPSSSAVQHLLPAVGSA